MTVPLRHLLCLLVAVAVAFTSFGLECRQVLKPATASEETPEKAEDDPQIEIKAERRRRLGVRRSLQPIAQQGVVRFSFSKQPVGAPRPSPRPMLAAGDATTGGPLPTLC